MLSAKTAKFSQHLTTYFVLYIIVEKKFFVRTVVFPQLLHISMISDFKFSFFKCLSLKVHIKFVRNTSKTMSGIV